MPKTTLAATQTTEVQTKLAISPRAVKMLKERAEENARLSREIKEKKERQTRLRAEVEDLCKKEKISAELLEGFAIEDDRFKLVAGESTRWDERAMIKDGIDPDTYKIRTPKKAYVKISRKGEKDDE